MIDSVETILAQSYRYTKQGAYQKGKYLFGRRELRRLILGTNSVENYQSVPKLNNEDFKTNQIIEKLSLFEKKFEKIELLEQEVHSKSKAVEGLVEKMSDLNTNLIKKETTIEYMLLKIKDLEKVNEDVMYEQKKSRAHNYVIDVDKLRNHLMGQYTKNQRSQNVLAHIPF